MTLTSTPAYITVVGEDHIIILPKEIPIGAKVTITVVPPTELSRQGDEERQGRFGKTLTAIHEASAAGKPEPPLSDAELDDLIKKAHKAPPG
jgi:hypothetical protein